MTQVLPNARADSGPVFVISLGQEFYPNPCVTCNYDVSQINNYYGDVYNVHNDLFGDSAGQISTSNTGYPTLAVWYFKTFVYNPHALADLHLYIDYWVNAYVYASPYCSTAWLMAQFGVANGAVNSYTAYQTYAIQMHTFEWDQEITTGSSSCSTSPSINSQNQQKVWDADLYQSDCPSFCVFTIGATYTFELEFLITANPGSYIQNTQRTGPAYLDAGFYGSNTDFTNSNFCTILSYQSSPVTGCPPPHTGGGGGGGCSPAPILPDRKVKASPNIGEPIPC